MAEPSTTPLSTALRGLGPSATLAINERSNALIAAGREVFKLGLGQSPFPVPEVVVETLRRHAHEKDYLPVRGLPALREAVAAYHRRRHGLETAAADVLIGPGSKELMFLLRLAFDGPLLLPAPSWVSYAPQGTLAGRPVRWLPTVPADGWRLAPDVLADEARRLGGAPALLLLNYPCNPTGHTYRARHLEALAEVCRRHGLLVLSDEIYGELDHRGAHVSIARYYPEGSLVSAGLSKWCGAGGWRLGTFAVPRAQHWLLDAVAVAASETFTSVSAPIQHAAVRAFEGGSEIDAYLHQSRRLLAALGRHATARLRAAGCRLDDPDGAFYLFPDASPLAARLGARGRATSADVCEHLLAETGVAVLPGSAFGRPADELSLRLAYVDFDGAAALAAAAEVPDDEPLGAGFLAAHAPRTVAGIERLAAWLAA